MKQHNDNGWDENAYLAGNQFSQSQHGGRNNISQTTDWKQRSYDFDHSATCNVRNSSVHDLLSVLRQIQMMLAAEEIQKQLAHLEPSPIMLHNIVSQRISRTLGNDNQSIQSTRAQEPIAGHQLLGEALVQELVADTMQRLYSCSILKLARESIHSNSTASEQNHVTNMKLHVDQMKKDRDNILKVLLRSRQPMSEYNHVRQEYISAMAKYNTISGFTKREKPAYTMRETIDDVATSAFHGIKPSTDASFSQSDRTLAQARDSSMQSSRIHRDRKSVQEIAEHLRQHQLDFRARLQRNRDSSRSTRQAATPLRARRRRRSYSSSSSYSSHSIQASVPSTSLYSAHALQASVPPSLYKSRYVEQDSGAVHDNDARIATDTPLRQDGMAESRLKQEVLLLEVQRNQAEQQSQIESKRLVETVKKIEMKAKQIETSAKASNEAKDQEIRSLKDQIGMWKTIALHSVKLINLPKEVSGDRVKQWLAEYSGKVNESQSASSNHYAILKQVLAVSMRAIPDSMSFDKEPSFTNDVLSNERKPELQNESCVLEEADEQQNAPLKGPQQVVPQRDTFSIQQDKLETKVIEQTEMEEQDSLEMAVVHVEQDPVVDHSKTELVDIEHSKTEVVNVTQGTSETELVDARQDIPETKLVIVQQDTSEIEPLVVQQDTLDTGLVDARQDTPETKLVIVQQDTPETKLGIVQQDTSETELAEARQGTSETELVIVQPDTSETEPLVVQQDNSVIEIDAGHDQSRSEAMNPDQDFEESEELVVEANPSMIELANVMVTEKQPNAPMQFNDSSTEKDSTQEEPSKNTRHVDINISGLWNTDTNERNHQMSSRAQEESNCFEGNTRSTTTSSDDKLGTVDQAIQTMQWNEDTIRSECDTVELSDARLFDELQNKARAIANILQGVNDPRFAVVEALKFDTLLLHKYENITVLCKEISKWHSSVNGETLSINRRDLIKMDAAWKSSTCDSLHALELLQQNTMVQVMNLKHEIFHELDDKFGI